MGCALLSKIAVAAVLFAGAGCAEKSEPSTTAAEPAPPSAPATANGSETAEPASLPVGSGEGGVQLVSLGNFDSPLHVGFNKHYPGRTYVVEQDGMVRVIKGGATLNRPFLNIRKLVRSGGEEGLLSIAFHPLKKHKRLFYVYYTNRKGHIQVDEFRLDTADRAKRNSRRKVIVVKHGYASNHNGGQLQFGPDRRLYIGTGDGGGGGDPLGSGQNRKTLLGALLRINPLKKGKRAYTSPKGNPFKGKNKNGRDEIYAIGLRNPYRFSFDRTNGRIAIGDVGQGDWEEVNIVSRGKLAGANFGWNRFEGLDIYESSTRTPSNSKHTKPVFAYNHSGGNCSITGGYIVRDTRLPTLYGRYIYADFCRGELRSVLTNGSDDRPLGPDLPNPSTFGESPAGHLHAASLNGNVYRFDPLP